MTKINDKMPIHIEKTAQKALGIREVPKEKVSLDY